MRTLVFGKTTVGSNEWYYTANRKIGSWYYTSGESINALVCRFRVDRSSQFPKARGVIYDSAGRLVAVSNEILLRGDNPDDLVNAPRTFLFPSDVVLPEGSYFLGIHMGIVSYDGDIRIGSDTVATQNGGVIPDNYDDGTSDPIDAEAPVEKNWQNFDVYATMLGAGPQPPTAVITISVMPTTQVGTPIDFSGINSTPGFNGEKATVIVEYLWDFGGGDVATGRDMQKAYNTAGDYRVALRVTDEQGLQDTAEIMVYIKPVGGYPSFAVGFEDDGDFSVGSERVGSQGNFKYWGRESYYWTSQKFEPETTIKHSGLRSAKLELVNPIDDSSRRIQVYHDVNPFAEHIWQECWYYLPADFPWYANPQAGFWHMLHVILSERKSENTPIDYQQFACGIGVMWHTYREKPVFDFLIAHTVVDNDNNGVNDAVEHPEQFTEMEDYLELGSEGVPTARWFKIKTHVYRNINDWRTNPKGGFIEVWIEDELGNNIYKKYDNIRTIGIDPERIAALTPWVSEQRTQAYLDAGFSLYAGGLTGAPEFGTSCKIYVDDFSITLTPTPPTPPLTIAPVIEATAGLILIGVAVS